MSQSNVTPINGTQTNQRSADYPVQPIFLERWSPRAYEPAVMSEHTLMTILEAARWAPSAYNVQPWRFVYALRGDEHWGRVFSILNDFNAGWAHNASALVVMVSKTEVEVDGQTTPFPSHSLDAGAAWGYLALQAAQSGYQAHGMTGIDFDKARDVLGVQEPFKVEMAIAIGKTGSPEILPEELREREVPSPRLPLTDIAYGGRMQP